MQRVRAAGSELIEDQEIFRRVAVERGCPGASSPTYCCESRLVRVHGAVPERRPDRSSGAPGGVAVGYTLSNPDGDDGAPLTDYDVIGSRARGTGMFALEGAARFNLLCIPPLRRERDVGLSRCWSRRESAASATRCSCRSARLVDSAPRRSRRCATGRSAATSAVMYFPRVQAFDRLRGRVETFGSCGAAAGMIARSDETWPVWAAAESEEAHPAAGAASGGRRV